MKKVLMALMMTLMFWNVSEGQVVNSVAGIEFGTDKRTAINYLIDHFGDRYKIDGDVVYFYDVNVGGINYGLTSFQFQNSRFVSCVLSCRYEMSQLDMAKAKFAQIETVYRKKYQNGLKLPTSDGFETIITGQSKYNEDLFAIQIELSKYGTTGSNYYYYYFVVVKYYGFNTDDDI